MQPMTVRKTPTMCFLVLALALMGRDGEAQCTGGDHFVVCPSLDTIFIIQTWFEFQPHYLAAISLASGELKWRVDLSQTMVHSNPAATADVVAFSTGDGVPEEISAFDVKTGKAAWKIRTKSFSDTSVGTVIIGESAVPKDLIGIDGKTGTVVWSPSAKRGNWAFFYGSSGRLLLTDDDVLDAYSGRSVKHWPKDWEVRTGAFGGRFVAVGTEGSEEDPSTVAVYSLPDYKLMWIKNGLRQYTVTGLAADADHIFDAIYRKPGSPFDPGEVRLEMLSAASGKTLWSKTINSAALFPSPVGLAEGVAVFATGESPDSKTVQGFNAATGEMKWTVRTDKKISEVVCPNKTCYIDAPTGEILAIDVSSGAQRWYRIPTQ
jgi:outer membrane protein assembly factor BamB